LKDKPAPLGLKPPMQEQHKRDPAAAQEPDPGEVEDERARRAAGGTGQQRGLDLLAPRVVEVPRDGDDAIPSVLLDRERRHGASPGDRPPIPIGLMFSRMMRHFPAIGRIG